MVPSADGMAVAPSSGGCWRRTVPSTCMVGRQIHLYQEGTLIDVHTWNNKGMAIHLIKRWVFLDELMLMTGKYL